MTLAKRVEGMTRQTGVHAAGVVIGTKPLIETVPLYRDAKSGAVMTQFDMRCVEKIGLIKFDFLGLRTLTTIADAERRVRANGAAAQSASTTWGYHWALAWR